MDIYGWQNRIFLKKKFMDKYLDPEGYIFLLSYALR